MVGRDGFEPSNSERADLQSAAFNHFAIDPKRLRALALVGVIHVCVKNNVSRASEYFYSVR